jgi:phage replication initiation protein
MKYDELILFDWFSVTAKHVSAEGMIRLLGMEPAIFETTYGVRGYLHRLYYDGININFGGEGKEEVWLEMSGKGCRAFETYGHGKWKLLFEETLSEPEYHITRLDVAFDDHIGILDLKVLADNVHQGNYVTEFRKSGVIHEYAGGQEAITIYHGSPKSDVYFRIYDKAIERNREDEGHWVRFEIQLRDDHAKRFLDLMVLQNVGDVFAKTVNKYIRYVENPGADTNKRRWPVAGFWYRFISTSEKVKLYVAPGVDYNFDALEHYVVDMAGAAAAAYVKFVGLEAFMEKCDTKFKLTRNPKYHELLRKYELLTEKERGEEVNVS